MRLPPHVLIAFAAVTASVPAGGRAGDEPLNRSSIAFALPEKDLLPESLAYDPKTRSFFVSSTRKGKIVRYAADGRVSDFVGPRQHGLYMTVGMKADVKRRFLWVASSYGSNLEDYRRQDGAPAALFKFDLDTAALLGRWALDDGATHFLNDVALAPNGDVYVTHMFDAAQVYRLEARTGTFAPWYRGDASLRDPNGIACTEDGRRLYVAHEGGISAIDVATRERVALTAPAKLALGGVDGLYLFHDALIAVLPGHRKVVKYPLRADGLGVTGAELLEYKHPLFDEPTAGVIVDGSLYYIANAQFGRFDENGRLFPPARLYQPVILKVALD